MLQVRVEAIKPETADTATFYLKPVSGNPVVYKAGQFITLVINHHGEEIRRSYSLSSSPDEDLLSITVKRVANGEISRYLLTYAKVGDVWNVVEPAGRFTPPANARGKELFYFAAGGGIPPVYAHIKYLLKHEANCHLTLFYSNINPQSVIYKQQLDELASRHPDQLTVIHLLSSEVNRLNNILVEKLVKQHVKQNMNAAEFYLCGPFTYMRMVRLTLLYMGIVPGQIHRETFVLETVPASTAVSNFAPHKVRVYFNHEWHDLMTGENQTILQAALQNQLHLPYSCANGVCAACAVKCKSGQVTMVKNEVLTDDEIKQGWVLTCTGYAMNDGVQLDYDM
ncbi:ferredoxin--NADP reductase [Mucilaginibacter sp. Bleaf8]|uniref:ferredoxin--NADP reductase n=1 Tax=Mucilaginibacter sp. Bleaf8 TaxID=2834430 RepID=UPI001BCC4DA3|nr:ferredoxin--NADP reductase [Mucilaginibacter sp. Bleaf8]MBS7566536.1 ferredoxin--NADP reductase [Mucilaginibacter sp. Bleaf8]